jgi:plasmid stabilization system protein ParE
MKIRWTGRALRDLARIRDFLLPVNPAAAAKAVRTLQTAVSVLGDRPRIGAPIERYRPLEVRRLCVCSSANMRFGMKSWMRLSASFTSGTPAKTAEFASRRRISMIEAKNTVGGAERHGGQSGY